MEINFNQVGNFSGVGNGDIIPNPTSIQFGPDGRLYVSEQNGQINAFTLDIVDGEVVAVAHELLTLGNGQGVVQGIQNHNDDGTEVSGPQPGGNTDNRQVTGIVVTGEADAPVLYISSSDPRIASNGEVNLDTNSGVVTRVTGTPDGSGGFTWESVDIIRGLPRSEENHAVNGMQLSPDGTKLYLQVGGFTNNGAPSAFFSYTSEYALSGALLEIDLVDIESRDILMDPNGGQDGTSRSYIYDLPTLDDPNTANITDGVGEDEFGMDEDGPWGGNDGLNQAILPADAPLRIYADGLRNPYDVVLTRDGKFFTVDNGSNGNLGGNPLTDGNGEAINIPNNGGDGDPEPLFQLVEGGYYGHPNPIRSNQDQSHTVYNNSGNPDGSLAVNTVPDLSALVPDAVNIADGYLIDPSKFAAAPGQNLDDLTQEELEARLLESGIRVDRNSNESNSILTTGSSTNGITEYVGDAFDGAIDGALLVTQFNGSVSLINVNDAGDGVDPLINPGNDGILGTADDVVQDADGFTPIITGQGSPLDVTVGPAGSQFAGMIFVAEFGPDNIKIFAPSDLVLPDDPDFDNDGLLNTVDPFGRDASNGSSVFVFAGTELTFDFDPNQDGNLPGPEGIATGLTGVAANGTTDYEQFFLEESTRPGQDTQLDNVKFQTAAGGGTTVIEYVSNGNASGNSNDGEFLFQTGVTIAPTVETFTVTWNVFNPGFGPSQSTNGGGFTVGANQEVGGFIGTGDQSNFLKVVATESSANGPGFLVELENNDISVASQFIAAADLFTNQSSNASNIQIDLEVDVEAGTATPTIIYELAAGGTAQVSGSAIDLSGSNVLEAINGNFQTGVQDTGLALGLWSTNGDADEADAFQAIFDDISLTATGDESRQVLYRINVGGEELAALDGGPAFAEDSSANPSEFRVAGQNNFDNFDVTAGASVPGYVPDALFTTARFDPAAGPEMKWEFPAAIPGFYEVTLLTGNGFPGASEVGERIYDVTVEGEVPSAFNDIDPVALFGNGVGGAITALVEVTDGTLDLEFIHDVENPNLYGIEIARIGSAIEVPLVVNVVGGDQTVNEDDGTVSISLLTNQTVPSDETVTIDFELSSGSATAGEDFTIDLPGATLENGVYSGQLTIAGTSSDVQLQIALNDDILIEDAEDFDFTIVGVSDNAEIGVDTANVTISDNDNAPGEIVLAINAGGPALSQDGIDFIAGPAASGPFLNGSAFSDGASGNGVQPVFDGTVFETELFGGGTGDPSLNFAADLGPGEYTITLYFAEIFLPNPANGADTRVFDVDIEGVNVIDDLNILETNGGDINQTIVFDVPGVFTPGPNGTLDIDFTPSVDNAKISAIVIRAAGDEDTVAPVANVGLTAPTDAQDAFVATIAFSEAIAGLESDDVTLNGPNGLTLTNGVVVLAANNESATVTFDAPVAGFANGDYSVDLADAAVLDAAANPNAAASSPTVGLALALETDEIYDENVNGDMSDDREAPTDLGTLALGSNIVSLAAADSNGDEVNFAADRDYFTIVVPEGTVLNAINLLEYEAGGGDNNLAFLALSDSDTINVDPDAATSSQSEPVDSNLIGGALIGDAQQGTDILDDLGAGIVAGPGFSGALPSGTYTFWLNQNLDISRLKLDIVLTDAPDAAPVFDAATPSEISVFENSTGVLADFDATDPDGDTVTYSLTGDDAAAFSIDENTGELSFVASPDFEAPIDTGGDNTYDINVVATANGVDTSTAVTVNVNDVPEVTVGDVVLAVNAGGPAINFNGIDFAANTGNTGGGTGGFFSNGTAFGDGGGGNGPQPIFDNTPFETERFAGDLEFTGTLPEGQYQIELYMAELFQSTAGQRVFDILVEGQLVVDDYDLLAETGNDFNQSQIITLPGLYSPGADGVLNINFEALGDDGVDNGKVNAIVIREVDDPRPVVSIGDALPVDESGDVGVTTLDFPITFSETPATDITISVEIDNKGVVTTQDVALGTTGGVLSVDVANDDVFDGPDAISVTITGVTVGAEFVRFDGPGASAEGIVNEDETSPADVDADGILNIDDPFATDASNGLGRTLEAGGEIVQDFETPTEDPFSAEAGFSGVLINQDFDAAGVEVGDPLGELTNEDKVTIADGVLSVTSSEQDAFSTGTGGNNTLRDGYQSGVDVSGVDTFEVEARVSSEDFLTKQATTNGFEQFGIQLGAGGVDDFVKIVISDQNTGAPRIQIAHNGSLDGGEGNDNIGVGEAINLDPALIEDIVFKLVVDKTAGTVVGQAEFFDTAGNSLTSYTTETRTIATGSSLEQALNGANPLTGGTGGLAYGIFVSDFSGGGTANQITADYDYLTIRALDAIDISIGAGETIVEGGDDASDALNFALTAGSFTGDATVAYTVNGEVAEAVISFVDGAGTLTVEAAQDDLANGDEVFDVVLTGGSANGSALNVVQGASSGTVTEDDFAPVGTEDVAAGRPGEPLIIDVLENDTDADSDASELSVAQLSDPTSGTVEVDLDGNVVYTPTDPLFEGADSFTYTLVDAAGNESAPVTVNVTIDALPQISIEGPLAPIAEVEGAEAAFTLSLSEAAEGDVTVTFAIAGVDATDGEDIDVTQTSVIIPQGDLTADIIVPILNDDIVEALESFTVTIVDAVVGGESLPVAAGGESAAAEIAAETQQDGTTGDESIDVEVEDEVIDISSGGTDNVSGTAEELDDLTIVGLEEGDSFTLENGPAGPQANIVTTESGSLTLGIDTDGNTGTIETELTLEGGVFEDPSQSFQPNDFQVEYDAETGETTFTFAPDAPAIPVRIQAEDFDDLGGTFSNFFTENQGAADEGQVIRVATGNIAALATLPLDGLGIEAGENNLSVRFFDEADGVSTLIVRIRDDSGAITFEDTIIFDQDGGANAAQAQNLRTVTFDGVDVQPGSTLELDGVSGALSPNQTELLRIDYVEFVAATVIVDPNNQGPQTIAPIADVTLTQDELFEFDLQLPIPTFIDPDEDPLTITVDNPLFTVVDGILTANPTNDDAVDFFNAGSAPVVVTVTATDPGGLFTQQTFTLLDVVNVNDAPEILPVADVEADAGEAIAPIDLSAIATDPDAVFGDTVTIEVAGLPDGVTYDDQTMTISGAPTAPGSSTVTVTATDVDGAETFLTFAIDVFGGVVEGDPVRIQAEDFNLETGFFIENQGAADEGQVIRVATGNVVGVASLDLDGAGVETGQNKLAVTFFDESDGVSVLQVRIRDDAGAITFEDTITFDQDGGASAAQAQNLRTVEFPSVVVSPGSTLELDGLSGTIGGGQTELMRIDYVEFTSISGEVGNFRPFPIPTFDTALEGFSGLLSIDLSLAFGDPEEDPLTFELGADAPDFLSIDPVTGELSATDAPIGSFEFDVTVTDVTGSNQPATQTFTLNLEENPEVPPAVLTPVDPQIAPEDGLFSLDLSAVFAETNEDVFTLEVGLAPAIEGDPLLPLPAWLTFEPTTGILSGTPAQEDIADLTIAIVATDNDGSTTTTFPLTVENINDAPEAIDPSPIADQLAEVGEPFAFDLPAVDTLFTDEDLLLPDTTEVLSIAFDPATLPDGVTINETTGALEGSPTSDGIFAVDVIATDADGETATSTFNIVVGPVEGPTDGQALFTANATGGSLIGASTFSTNSMQITNQSANGVAIAQVIIDLSNTFIPDTVFDTGNPPAGDTANKPFQQDGQTNGLTLNTDYTVSEALPFDNGNNQLILDFNPGAFAVGEVLSFSIDIDPVTATVGAIGGAVSGQELAGGTVTVVFEDGSSATSSITPDGGSVAASALVQAGQVEVAPTLTLGDGSIAPRVVNEADLPITVDAGIENANGTARVYILDTAFVSNGDSASVNPPGGADAIQGNNAQAFSVVVDVQLDENGQFNGTIPVTRSTTQEGNANGNLGFNYFAAGIVDADGDVKTLSDTLVVEFDPDANVPPVLPPELGDVLLRINAFGEEVAAADDGPNWLADTTANPSPFYSSSQNRGDTDGTPATPNLPNVPNEIFETARSDNAPFSFDIPISQLSGVQIGDVITVNLYFAEAFDGNNSPGQRIFDVTLEGATAIDDLDVADQFAGGGGVISTAIEVTDDVINIGFVNNGTDNAIVSGLEIVEGGEDPIGPGPSDDDAVAILEALNDVDSDGSYGAGATGSAVLTILDGEENVALSNFGSNSFQLTNTGDKQIAGVVIDFRDAVFNDSVVDPDGSGGDNVAKDFAISTDGGTGAFVDLSDVYQFAGDNPLPNTTGTGQTSNGGFRGILIKFDGSDGGFVNGETVGFSGDMDPNSIAGLDKGGANGVDPGAIAGWDVGGVGGAELIGSSFTVLFDDGTTATGYIGSDESQAGGIGEAVEGRSAQTATLTIETGGQFVDSGGTGTYDADAPVITVDGPAGATVRVTLQKGFNPVTNDSNGIADLVADRLADAQSDFQVNNAFDVQTFDVVLDGNGTATLPVNAFDYNSTSSGASFNGDDVQPLAFTAAVITPVTDNSPDVLQGDSNVAAGPISAPVYLTNPTQTPVDGEAPVDGFFQGIGSGNNYRFKIQIEDVNGGPNGGLSPNGQWTYVAEDSAADNNGNSQGTGYYVWGDPGSSALNGVQNNSVLQYRIFVPEGQTGTYNLRFSVAQDNNGLPGDQQNDLWVNFLSESNPSLEIEDFLVSGANEAEPVSNGYIKLFGGPGNGNFGFASQIDGAPGNFGAQLEITEAGFYTIEVAGRSQGYHVDFLELFKGSTPATGASNSVFSTDEPIDPGTPGFNISVLDTSDETATPIDGNLQQGDVVDLGDYGSFINFLLELDDGSDPGSFFFELLDSGGNVIATKTENAAAFEFQVNTADLTPGDVTLRYTTFDEDGGPGGGGSQVGTPVEVDFTLVGDVVIPSDTTQGFNVAIFDTNDETTTPIDGDVQDGDVIDLSLFDDVFNIELELDDGSDPGSFFFELLDAGGNVIASKNESFSAFEFGIDPAELSPGDVTFRYTTFNANGGNAGGGSQIGAPVELDFTLVDGPAPAAALFATSLAGPESGDLLDNWMESDQIDFGGSLEGPSSEPLGVELAEQEETETTGSKPIPTESDPFLDLGVGLLDDDDGWMGLG